MARQRRGGGFRPPELPLRGTLGTLLRTAAAQVGPLRDALERTAREGLSDARSRLDDALAARASGSRSRAPHRPPSRATGSDERDVALADLGAIVLDLIRDGEIDLAQLPEVRDLVAHLDELDASSSSDADPFHDDDSDEPYAPPPSRNRFDARGRDQSREDGSVSSKTWRPPPKKPPPRVWRPPVDNDEPAPSRHAARPADEITARSRPVPKPKDPLRKGGISFDDDDADLADYMHPDDVPPKPPKDGDA
ncbi:MAG TPA: hypothetical protein VMZ53_29510 [Kofleriaceae bacterium]|nr:hypothetical protein [Kofleriaceae bacterium]